MNRRAVAPSIDSPAAPPISDRQRRQRATSEAAWALQLEIERQDAAGFRDWERCVGAVVDSLGRAIFLGLFP